MPWSRALKQLLYDAYALVSAQSRGRYETLTYGGFPLTFARTTASIPLPHVQARDSQRVRLGQQGPISLSAGPSSAAD
jgi:hypothetical protein